MAESGSGGVMPPAADDATRDAAYDEGYGQVTREIAWARSRGWVPTERQLTVVLMRALKVYAAARGGKAVAGQHPKRLRGRAAAPADRLRQVVRDAAQND